MSEVGPIFGQALAGPLANFNATHERAHRSAEPWSPGLWQELSNLGLPLALVDEEMRRHPAGRTCFKLQRPNRG